jgi:hypothetical protein
MATSTLEKTFDSMIRKNPEKKVIPLPTIDGHFWVVRDGKIIDWDFPAEFAEIRRTWKCGTEKNYIPAPVVTQKIMTQMFKKAFSSVLESDDWNENMEEFKFWNKFANMPDVRYSCCFQNCILEIHERGGELVFGSLGFKKNNGVGYHYEWGGENYNSVSDFLTTPENRILDELMKTVDISRLATLAMDRAVTREKPKPKAKKSSDATRAKAIAQVNNKK